MAVIQCSSASIAYCSPRDDRVIELEFGRYVVLGQNIARALPHLLAAFGRAQIQNCTAGIHLLFKITGTAVYLCCSHCFQGVGIIESWLRRRFAPDSELPHVFHES
jgi:Na+/phosphate symporter